MIVTTDTILIQNNVAHQIWRNTTKAQVPPMTAELVAALVEVPAGTVNEGATWDGSIWTAPPARPVIIDYATFRARWTDAEKQALHNARAANWQVDDYATLAAAQNAVSLTSDITIAAKAALVTAGCLTQDRADIVFGISA